jgi:4-amino-4-deoxy-L-arabinose transferase-like glycosyltransferase
MSSSGRAQGLESGSNRLILSISPDWLKKWGPLVVILLLTVSLRTLQLDLFYTRDELVHWRQSDEFFVALWQGDLEGTNTGSNYPQVTVFWLQALFNLVKYVMTLVSSGQVSLMEAVVNTPHTLAYLSERRLVIALATSAQVIGIYLLATNLFGRRVGWLAAFFVALNPWFLAESRVFRAEAFAAGFMILSVLAWLVHLKDRRWAYLALSGVMAGWAVLTKASSIFLIPIIGLAFLLDWLFGDYEHRWSRFGATLYRGLIWVGVAVAAFWLGWPSMWVNPGPPLRTILNRGITLTQVKSAWHGDVFFLGRLLPGDPGPLFYPVVIGFGTTLVIWIGVVLALVALWSGRRRWKQEAVPPDTLIVWRRPWPVAAIWMWLLYGAVIFVGLTSIISKVGRYTLPVLSGLDILAALGFGWLLQQVGERDSFPRWAANGVVLTVCVAQLAFVLPTYPYFYSYWNPVLGGGAAAARAIPVGSGEGLDQAVDFLNQLPEAERSILVCGASRGWCEGKFSGTTWSKDTLGSSKWMQADYVLPYIAWSQRQEYPQEVIDYLSRQSPIYQVELGGATYAWLYRVPEVSHFSGTKLEGRGTLYGYNLSEAEVQAGDVLTATLYWRNEGQQPGDAFFVRVEDAADYVWATAYAEPREGFEEAAVTRKEIVESEARLRLPIGMPPGHYFLKMGFVTDGGERLVGRFELPDDGDDVTVGLPDTYSGVDEDVVPHSLELVTEDVTLMGYDLWPGAIEAGEKGWLTLYWRAEREGPRDYVVGIRLLGLDGDEVAYWLGRPVYSGYGTSEWGAGQVVQDPWELWMPEEVVPGEYELELVLYDGVTGEPVVRTLIAPWSVSAPYATQ